MHAAVLFICQSCEFEEVRKSILLGTRLVALVSLIKHCFAPLKHHQIPPLKPNPASAVSAGAMLSAAQRKPSRPAPSSASSVVSSDEAVLGWPLYLPALFKVLTLLISQALPLDQAVHIKYNLIRSLNTNSRFSASIFVLNVL